MDPSLLAHHPHENFYCAGGHQERAPVPYHAHIGSSGLRLAGIEHPIRRCVHSTTHGPEFVVPSFLVREKVTFYTLLVFVASRPSRGMD